MAISIAYIFLLSSFLSISKSQPVVGIGSVVIGQTPAALAAANLTSNPTLYFISRNRPTGTLPVYIALRPINATYNSDVDISCENLPVDSLIGYSEISFQNPVIRLAATGGVVSGTISYSANKEGRPIDIQCYGVSVLATNQQFTRVTSMSAKVSIQVLKPPTVNFCSNIITVPNIIGVTTSSFTLQLSENVIENNVTISCSNITNTASGGFIGNPLIIQPNTAVIGSNAVTMTYTVVSATGNPVAVACQAQSQNSGTQYLSTTSLGQSSIFQADNSLVLLFPSSLQVQGIAFETSLVINAPLSTQAQSVNFVCRVQVVENLQMVNSILNAYNCTTLSPQQVNNATESSQNSTWTIVNPNLVFTAGQKSKIVQVQRSSSPSTSIRESVLVVCCAPRESNVNPVYNGSLTSAIAIVELRPVLPITWATAADSQLVAETAFPNPAYVPLAPCPCDLTPAVCDIGCCCDANCTTADKATFTCITSLFGGAQNIEPRDESCKSVKSIYRPNWYNLLCIVSEWTPVLGYLYQTDASLKTNNAFIEKERTSTQPSFANTDSRVLQENVNVTAGYVKGVGIRTITGGLSAVLTLPGKMFDGGCNRGSLVRFLTDTTSICVQRMSAAACQTGSVFSTRTYVLASGIRGPPCPDRLHVTAKAGTTGNLNVYTNYRCASDVGPYTVRKLPPIAPASSFSDVNKTALDSCDFNSEGIYSCPIVADPVIPVTIAPTCSWDDGQTLPPLPVWDNVNNICRNAVLNVSYVFYWSGTSLTNLTAQYVLGDVPLNVVYNQNVVTTETVVNAATNVKETRITTQNVNVSYPSDISQSFIVQFAHVGQTTSSNRSDENFLTEISGNPGYLAEKNLIGAVRNVNGQYNASKIYFPQYFSPSGDTITCRMAGKDTVKFGQSIQGNCLMYLGASDFANCDRLRRYLFSVLDAMMPMEFMSIVGNPNLTDSRHWITVDRQNVTNIVNNETSIVGMSGGGRCDNLPIGIRLAVMHADSGKLADQYINTLVNVRVDYQFSTLQMSCSGLNAGACQAQSNATQAFIFYSSAQFFLVRSTYAVQSRREQAYWSCVQEFCQEEAMFPFTKYFQGGTYEESILWMIAIWGVWLGYFMITRPWW